MYFSGKITNSFFTFLNRYDLDTSRFFEMTALEIDFIKDPDSYMSAELVELLLRNIQRAYQDRFIDKDLVSTVAHNAPDLQAWGGLESALAYFVENPIDMYQKIDKFFGFFVSPPILIHNQKNEKEFFSFDIDFDKQKFRATAQYFLSVMEILPVFLGKEQTEATWEGSTIKIYHSQEETLPLPLSPLKKKDPKYLISSLKAREIIDSRGQPTLEVDLFCKNKRVSRGLVPSGASTGHFEAKELRDKDPHYFFSKGLKKACQNVEKLSKVLKGQHVQEQEYIDQLLLKSDGSPLKENLGANTLLSVSLACLRAGAYLSKKPLYEYASLGQSQFSLPVPLMNIINGGVHGSNSLSIQEFMIVPWDFPSFKEALRAGCEIFYILKQELKAKGFSIAVGDEGGFTPKFSSSRQAFEFILSAIEKSSYSQKVALALDCASSEFYKKDHYLFEGQKKSADEMIAVYEQWIQDYPLISIEDGLAEEDWTGWKQMTQKLGHQIQLVGDDLFVTQKNRVERGLKEQAGNALLVKYNQVGTISETKSAVLTAQQGDFACVFSHRSGETEDTSIADLSVAWGTEQIKTGSVSRGERTAKYNRLLRIEEELGSSAFYKGSSAFKKRKLK